MSHSCKVSGWWGAVRSCWRSTCTLNTFTSSKCVSFNDSYNFSLQSINNWWWECHLNAVTGSFIHSFIQSVMFEARGHASFIHSIIHSVMFEVRGHAKFMNSIIHSFMFEAVGIPVRDHNDRQRQTETDRDRQRQTETDKHGIGLGGRFWGAAPMR